MVYQITENIFAIGKTIHKPDKKFTFIAYLITGNVNVLIDTLPLRYADMLRQELKKLLGNEKLDFLVLNHSEEDHSGALSEIQKEYPEMEIYCTEECQERLSEQLKNKKYHLVKSADEVSLGDNVFHFYKTPGLHWDDNMVTFLEKENILFSNDLFGQLAACEPPIDHQYAEENFMQALSDYYIRVFSEASKEQKKNAIDVLKLPVCMIAPAHGILIKKMLSPTLEYYKREFSQQLRT